MPSRRLDLVEAGHAEEHNAGQRKAEKQAGDQIRRGADKCEVLCRSRAGGEELAGTGCPSDLKMGENEMMKTTRHGAVRIRRSIDRPTFTVILTCDVGPLGEGRTAVSTAINAPRVPS